MELLIVMAVMLCVVIIFAFAIAGIVRWIAETVFGATDDWLEYGDDEL